MFRRGAVHVCPIVWAAPGGFLVVMVKAEPMHGDEDVLRLPVPMLDGVEIGAEIALKNYGYVAGELVAIDYAPVY